VLRECVAVDWPEIFVAAMMSKGAAENRVNAAMVLQPHVPNKKLLIELWILEMLAHAF
jgi:hypothetical protein